MAKKISNKAQRTQSEGRARVFAALSASLRLQILDVLSGGETNVTTLVNKLNAEQPNVSRHLSILRNAGLVQVRRSGLQRLYRLISPAVTRLIEASDPLTAGNKGG